jgi:hypothetical protein
MLLTGFASNVSANSLDELKKVKDAAEKATQALEKVSKQKEAPAGTKNAQVPDEKQKTQGATSGTTQLVEADFDALMQSYKERYGLILAAYDQWVADGVANKKLKDYGAYFCENSLSETVELVIQLFSTGLKIDADPCNVDEYNLQVYEAISPTSLRYGASDWEDYKGNASKATKLYRGIKDDMYPNLLAQVNAHLKRLEDLHSGKIAGALGQDLGIPLHTFVSVVFLEMTFVFSEEEFDVTVLDKNWIPKLRRIAELALYTKISSETDVKNRIKNWGITPTIFTAYADLVEDSPRKKKIDAVYQKLLFSEETSPNAEKYENLAMTYATINHCYKSRQGYAVVYVNQEQYASATSKFKRKGNAIELSDSLKERLRNKANRAVTPFGDWSSDYKSETESECEMALFLLNNQ